MSSNDIQMSNIIDNNEPNQINYVNPSFDTSSVDVNKMNKVRNVRLVYCGDGVVEECDEDEEEKERLEREEKEKQLELKKKRDIEAKNLSWIPWFGYIAVKSAERTLEICDNAGEKLAWWLGITKPKFLYEIEEYQRIQKEIEKMNEDDIAEEIVIGIDENGLKKTYLNNDQKVDVNKRLFKKDDNYDNIANSSNLPDKLFQNNE